jgi:HEAT repeat protein
MMKTLRLLPLLVALPALAAPSPRRDLDVAVPPGTPIEWLREACRTGRGRGDVPRTPEEPKEGLPKETTGGKTEGEDVAGRTTTLGLDFGATDPFAYARVLTQDIAGHLRWVVPTPGTTKEDGPTGGGADAHWSYPPLPSDTLYWYVLAAYLRKLLHPALLSESECIEFLVELGEPALIAAEQAKNEKSCEAMVKAVRAQVTALPVKAPEIRKGRDARESMIFHLATEELTSAYAYELNPYFAQRTLSFGRAAVPVLIELSRDSHSFLARNATAVLANVPDSDAGEALLKLAKETKDNVIRNRAVGGLIRRRFPGTAEYLLGALKGGDPHFRCYAIHGLGMLGDRSAVLPILEAAKSGVDDPDVLWAAIPALGRLRDNRKEVVEFLKQQEARLAHPAAGLFDPPAPPGDPRMRMYAIDPPGTKARVVWEMTVIALARIGLDTARTTVLAEIEKGGGKPNPRQRMQPSTFSGLLTPTHYALLEALTGMGDDGMKWLRESVKNDAEDPAVRLTALMHVSVPKPDVDLLKMLVRAEGRPAALRALALRLLGENAPKEAEAVSKELLASWAIKPAAIPAPTDTVALSRAAGETFVVTTAMHLMGAFGKNDPKNLLQIVDRALWEIAEKKKQPKPPKPPDDTWRWYQRNTVVVEAPVLEAAIYELGRTKSDDGLDRLLALLGDEKLKVARAEAALALGAVRARGRSKEVTRALLAAMGGDVGWVRWCASRGLKAASGAEVETDWIYADGAERKAALEKVRKLVVSE